MNSALDRFERQLVTTSLELSSLDETPAAAPRSADTPHRLHRRALRVPPKRLLVSLAMMIVAAGGVATASSFLWPSQRLADGKVNCFMATHGTGAIDGRTLAVGEATA